MDAFAKSLSELEERIEEKGVNNIDLSDEISEYLYEKENTFLVEVCQSNSLPDEYSTFKFNNTESIDTMLSKILYPFYYDAIEERFEQELET